MAISVVTDEDVAAGVAAEGGRNGGGGGGNYNLNQRGRGRGRNQRGRGRGNGSNRQMNGTRVTFHVEGRNHGDLNADLDDYPSAQDQITRNNTQANAECNVLSTRDDRQPLINTPTGQQSLAQNNHNHNQTETTTVGSFFRTQAGAQVYCLRIQSLISSPASDRVIDDINGNWDLVNMKCVCYQVNLESHDAAELCVVQTFTFCADFIVLTENFTFRTFFANYKGLTTGDLSDPIWL